MDFARGDCFTKAGNTFTGLIFANNPNSFLSFNKPCSGHILAFGLSSYSGAPIAPNRIASESLQTFNVLSGKAVLYFFIAVAPTAAFLKVKE